MEFVQEIDYEKLYGKTNLSLPDENLMIYSIISKAQFIYETKKLFDGLAQLYQLHSNNKRSQG